MRCIPISCFLFVFLNVSIIVSVAEVWAAEPTLARLSLWVSTERLTAFEAAYEEKVVPILKTHGLVKASVRDERTKVEGIFSWLFEMKAPSEIPDRWRGLNKDSAWQDVLRDLGSAFEGTAPEGKIQWLFWFYFAPAGPGQVVSAGRGIGHWKNWGVADGLPGNSVFL